MRTYSTLQVAKRIGVSLPTLRRWLAAGFVRPSITMPIDGGKKLGRWTDADVERARRFKATQKRGPKPKRK